MTNFSIKKRKNQSAFNEYHNQIFSLLEQGYSVPQIFEYLKQKSQNNELLLNGLYSFIRRKKEKGLNKILPEIKTTEKENIQTEIKSEHESTPESNFSSVEKETEELSPTEIFRRKFGDTPPPAKSDDDF